MANVSNMTKEERWEFERDSWEKTYKLFFEAFSVDQPFWDMFWKHFDIYVWKACKRNAIAQYLEWEYLVPHLKDFGITYYSGIDTFLEEWKDAVHGALKESVYNEDNNDTND